MTVAVTSFLVLTADGGKHPAGLRLGSVSLKRTGWYFIPAYQSSPSRRGHPTPEAALKRCKHPYKLVPSVRRDHTEI